jgi:hypothetical protein
MVNPPIPEFLAGDILLFTSRGDLPGWLGQWAARARGERPTYAVHTAQFLDAGRILEMDGTAQIRSISAVLGRPRGFEVWRCRALTAAQRAGLTGHALRYLHARFGWPKLLTHVLDDLANKILHHEVFFFRRLNHNDRYPICSWITAFAYDRALHYRFGVPPEWADPDQIHDWVNAHPGEWRRIYCRAAAVRPRALPAPAWF